MSLYERIKTNKEKNNNNISDDLVKLLQIIRSELLSQVETKQWNTKDEDALESKIAGLLDAYLANEQQFIPQHDKELVIKQVIQDLLGLGPIQPLIEDDSISEVMVNGPKDIFVEKGGKLTKTNSFFINNEHIKNVIDRIIAPIGRRLDESSPMVDARLSDGSRVNAIIPPLALNGPTITIRKFKKTNITVEQLVEWKSLNRDMAKFLDLTVRNHFNILVAGGTGSGKTTLLNLLSSFIPTNERIVTIEDAAELRLEQPHVVSLESRPPNIEGKGEITIRDLLRNSLRMRPDRIVIGEVRSGEALDMLQAMNTGHDGSLSTIHANSPRDVISRLETLVLMSGYELPIKAIREQIASAVDLIVQQQRFPDGTRKITNITRVEGIESDKIVLQDLFRFEEITTYKSPTIKGNFKKVGVIPDLSGDRWD